MYHIISNTERSGFSVKRVLSVLISFGILAAVLCGTSLTANAATIKGDINGDNKISTLDAFMILRIAVHAVEPTDEQKYSADFNNDGFVTVTDAFLVQKYSLEISYVLDEYAPNLRNRIELINLINSDREERGLTPLKYNDATLTVGQIRAEEYVNGNRDCRADGSAIDTVFPQCNLTARELIQYTAVTQKYGSTAHDYITKYSSATYESYFMSPQYKTICVGTFQDTTHPRLMQWVIYLSM